MANFIPDYGYEQYVSYPKYIVRCKTKSSIFHKRLENFFSRHKVYDYSDNGYIYTITHIQSLDNPNEYVEIKYCQYRCMYDSPEKEIIIHKNTKMIYVRDNFSTNEKHRYSCKTVG
jgi:hypothetical protein